jgi:Uma2 family endonuclease
MQTLITEIAEQRVILSNISWQTFEQLLKELGDNRSTRLAYNNGLLEIMTPLGPMRTITALLTIWLEQLQMS